MAQPDTAVEKVLVNESGIPIENDNGRGLSVWGITWKTVQGLGLGWTEDYLRSLTRQQAADFYTRYVWYPSRLGLLSDQPLADKVFDVGVNAGMGTAIKMLQSAAGVNADGILGPVSAEAVNAMDPDVAMAKFRAAGEQHYRDIVAADPSMQKFLNGWLARLDRA